MDEVETFQQQALEIRKPGADFDPSVEPQTGEEFLMHMLYERKQCKTVVVCPAPRHTETLPQVVLEPSENVSTRGAIDKVAHSLAPTVEWKAIQAADFQATRDKISQLRQQLHGSQSSYNSELEPPLTEDAAEWQRFCRHQQPLLRTLLRLSQRTLEQLLEFSCEWLLVGTEEAPTEDEMENDENAERSSSSATFDLSNAAGEQWLGSWLYATLACLHLPLEPDVHSTLRDIARTCIRLRSSLQPHETERAAPYNLFIHLIAKCFQQLDFAEFV